MVCVAQRPVLLWDMQIHKPEIQAAAKEESATLPSTHGRPSQSAYPAAQALQDFKAKWIVMRAGWEEEGNKDNMLALADNVTFISDTLEEIINMHSSLSLDQWLYVENMIQHLASDSNPISLRIGEGAWSVLLLATFINTCMAEEKWQVDIVDDRSARV